MDSIKIKNNEDYSRVWISEKKLIAKSYVVCYTT